MAVLKSCITCGTEKPLSDFYKNKKKSDGHFNECKKCHNKRRRRSSKGSAQARRKWDRIHYHRRRKNNPIRRHRQLVYNRLNNAIRRGKISRPEGCWHCGHKCQPEAHHSFYDIEHYDAVTWLCADCHKGAHEVTNKKGLHEAAQ